MYNGFYIIEVYKHKQLIKYNGLQVCRILCYPIFITLSLPTRAEHVPSFWNRSVPFVPLIEWSFPQERRSVLLCFVLFVPVIERLFPRNDAQPYCQLDRRRRVIYTTPTLQLCDLVAPLVRYVQVWHFQIYAVPYLSKHNVFFLVGSSSKETRIENMQ